MSARRILIVNPFGIGDTIFSMVVAQAIRDAWPKSFIGFLANERTESLVRLNPSIDHTLIFNRDQFRGFWRQSPVLFFRQFRALLAILREADFDTLIDFSLGREYSFFGWWVGIRDRIGFDFKNRGLFLTHKKKLAGYDEKPVVDTQFGLLPFLGIPIPGAKPAIPFRVPENADFKNRNILVLAPGGGRSWGANAVFKQWDPERFARVGNTLVKNKGYEIYLLGDDGEKELLGKTASFLEAPAKILAGEAIPKVCPLLKAAKLFIGNDGGLLHLANALGTPTVGLYGPVDERVYGPYRKEIPHAVLTEAVPCRPCYQHFHFPPCAYNRRCLEELSVERVLTASSAL